jgi:hypothetical protein
MNSADSGLARLRSISSIALRTRCSRVCVLISGGGCGAIGGSGASSIMMRSALRAGAGPQCWATRCEARCTTLVPPAQVSRSWSTMKSSSELAGTCGKRRLELRMVEPADAAAPALQQAEPRQDRMAIMPA